MENITDQSQPNSINYTTRWNTLYYLYQFQGVRRASYLDVSPEALSDGAQSRASPGGGHGRGSRRASVCMAAEALMAGMVARWL